jgi:hypothetical protein
MPELIAPAPDVVAAPKEFASPDGRVLGYCAWAGVFILLVANLPLFLCMGLHADVTMWDLCARNVLRGGVHYRDAVENNLPGMLWLHLAIRSTLGWRSEALRFVDFGVVSGIAWLLMRCLPPPRSHLVRAGMLFILFGFYFTTSEWCHCQRDTWMLLPGLAALHLRCRQVGRLNSEPAFSILAWAFLEGLLWAGAFWIKPFVAVPCLTCWLLSLALTRGPRRSWSRIWVDGAGMLAGGLVAGAVGITWLISSGAWPYFVEVMLVWTREYAGFDAKEGLGWMYLAGFVVRLFPWVLIHVIAVPVALRQIGSACVRPAENGRCATLSILLAGFYLAWLFQAIFLQHLFDYVHVPGILLGLTVVLMGCVQVQSLVPRMGLVLFVLFGMIVQYPTVYGRRLGVWERCLQEGSTVELRSQLALDPGENWTDLDQVRDYLQRQDIQDGELTCYSMRTTPLYLQLNLQPSTPYYFLQNALTIGVSQRGRIHANLASSRQRFVVCDLFGLRRNPGEMMLDDPETMPLPAMWQPPYRWSDKVVFRAGRYVVFAIDAAEMPDWLDDSFHL